MGGLRKVGHVALLAEVGQNLAGLAARVAGLRAGFGQVRSVDIDVVGAGEDGEVVGVGLGAGEDEQREGYS